MTNEEILKKGIKDSFIIKSNEGEEFRKICEELSTQIYKFVTRDPNLTNANVSRGMRNIVVEENRNAIILALGNLYFEYIEKSDNLNDKYDNYTKDILETSNNRNKLLKTIFSNNEMIYRMRKSSCRDFIRGIV